MNKFIFAPKVATALSFLLLLLLNMLLFFGRNLSQLRLPFLLHRFPDCYTHLSNFCISYLLLAIPCFVWLMMGVHQKPIFLYASLLLLANFVYELWLPILNTCDLVDAYYGVVGVIVALVFLLLSQRFGLNQNPTARPPKPNPDEAT